MRQLRQYRTLAALAAVLALALPGALWAQSQAGNLEGRVVDSSGAALPGATVTATNDATGLTRTETSDANGQFRFASLPVGTYRVAVDLSGFGEVVTEDVQLNVATDRRIEVTLSQAAVEETITVTSEPPLLVTEPAIGTVVTQNELENLPLNGRQFANLAVLAPGTSLAVNADPTKPGQLTVALAGGIGRNVNYVVDGGDNTDDTIGGALQNFNLDAVQEFKIQTQQYKAEYGRSSGGVLTVVTKTGTNEFAGAVYGFFRDDSWAEKTPSEELAGADKQKLSREQVGVSFGGPIVVDRAHFFASYGKTDRETFYTLDTRTATNPGGLFPGSDGGSFPTPFEDELITAKATWNINTR
ncbi:MAG TPA: carboxypeptidase-like regulatory domain-containing protein, partial [Thermoanaerobaculia bacterium]|nr:carboxypeptidase-like regulatory domain-containing protein [Thermoanaerobaculia bacterium]